MSSKIQESMLDMFLMNKKTAIHFIAVSVVCILACDESLPPYEQPENTLVITEVLATQGTIGSGIPILNVYLWGGNQYEETFDDTVSVSGHVRITWSDQPDLVSTLRLSNGNFTGTTPIQGSRLTLDPGDTFSMKTVWYFYSDSGEYIIDLMDYSNNDVRGNYEYSKPEIFVIEVELLIYRQIGRIESEPLEVEITGYRPSPDSSESSQRLSF